MSDLGTFLDSFISILSQFVGFLTSMTISVYGIEVNYAAIIFAFIVIGFVVSVYWKGARS